MRRETRQNLIALVGGFGIIAAVGVLCVRPAVVLPVGETTLENSIGVLYGDDSHLDHPEDAAADCRDVGEGDFDCSLAHFNEDSQHSYGRPIRSQYEVYVDGAGCWVVRRPGRVGEATDGCILLPAYFGY